MKKLITILSLFIVFTGHAQTINYSKTITQHLDKEGQLKSQVTKFAPGQVKVDQQHLVIDDLDYTILKHEAVETADEGYFTQSLMVVCTTKTGAYKVYQCILLLKPNKSLCEVIIKKSNSTHVSYVIQD